MFYSGAFLTKNGPLARVWLASTLEKKLNKHHILSEAIDTNVKDIICTTQAGQAPIALRLSGQLLLGLVRIYSQKAQYLLDDCHEALEKIDSYKMAFYSSNVDLINPHTAKPVFYKLPDAIDLDLVAPHSSLADLLRVPEPRTLGQDPTLLDFGRILDNKTMFQREERRFLGDDDNDYDDLGLDLGTEPRDGMAPSETITIARSTRLGCYNAALYGQTMPIDDDVNLYVDCNDYDTTVWSDDHSDVSMQHDNFTLGDSAQDHNDLSLSIAKTVNLYINSDQERNRGLASCDATCAPPRAAKRRKVMTEDTTTELHTSQLEAQQVDRSGITRKPYFLPRNRMLLQLLERQRSGEIVSSIMGPGRMEWWAPELSETFSKEMAGWRANREGQDGSVEDADADPPFGALEEEQSEDSLIGPDSGLVESEDDSVVTTMIRMDSVATPLLSDDGRSPTANDPIDFANLIPSRLLTSTLDLLRAHISPRNCGAIEMSFSNLCPRHKTARQDATRVFLDLLVLDQEGIVRLEQDSSSNGEVLIKKITL